MSSKDSQLTPEEQEIEKLENQLNLVEETEKQEAAFQAMPNKVNNISKKINNVDSKVGVLENVITELKKTINNVVEKTSGKLNKVTNGIIPTAQPQVAPGTGSVSVFYPSPPVPSHPTVLMPPGQTQTPPKVIQVQPQAQPIQSAGRVDESPELLQVGGGGSSRLSSQNVLRNLNKSLSKLNRNIQRNRSERKRKYMRSKLKRKYAI